MRIHPGRHSAAVDDQVVLLRIGMRINRPWKVHRWMPVMTAMTRMLRELDARPELGMLHAERALSGLCAIVDQWWDSYEHLEAFARGEVHVPAWRDFNRAVRDSGDVGIFHEAYRVRPGDVEAIYGNMPVVGLAAATNHVPTAHVAQSGRARMDPTVTDDPLLTPY
jgi:hypothetical protein